MEKTEHFESDELTLEGLLYQGDSERGVVITHPHPLYGGDMENAVVEAIARTFQRRFITTFRFNFRGVGKSRGEYSEGTGEARDVCAALEFLKKKGVSELYLAGYSFGAWINARLDCKPGLFDRMFMISPPVAFIEFGDEKPDSLELVITGSEDEFAPPSLIREMLPAWNPGAVLEIIEGADHFYWSHLGQLESVLTKYIG